MVGVSKGSAEFGAASFVFRSTNREVGVRVADFELDGERLAVSGRLDSDAEQELKNQLAALMLTGAEKVTIDLSQVEYIISACIGAIVALWIDLCAAGRKIKLDASPEVQKVLDSAGLTGVFAAASGE